MKFPFVGSAYKHRSVTVAAQRLVNMYIENVESPNEETRQVLIGTPGKLLFCTLPTSPMRGEWVVQVSGRAFAAAGNALYEIFADGTYSARGTLNTSTGIVSMADNGLQLMLVDGLYGYILTLATNVFAQITDVDFPGADTVCFQDGYFIFNSPNTGKFYITALYDGSSVNRLDVGTAEGTPDNIICLLNDHRFIWLFGTASTEVYFDSGNNSFPFDRVQNAYMEIGCAAKFSAAKLDNSVYWLGQDDKGRGLVYKAQNFSPIRISTHAIEFAIQSYSDISDAIAYTYQEEGHAYYVLSFPTGNATWVYDASTGEWFERAYLNNGSMGRDLGSFHMFAFGKHLIGDYRNGNIYQSSLDVYTDNGAPIKRLRACQHLTNAGKFSFYSQFQVSLEMGQGLDGGVNGSDPVGVLRISRDGGHTFSPEKSATLGKIGEYTARCQYNRLGRARDAVFEWSTTEPIKIVITGANLDAVAGIV